MPRKRVPQQSFNIKGLHIEQVYEFNFLSLIIDANLNRKAGNNRCIPLQSSKYCRYFYFFDIPE